MQREGCETLKKNPVCIIKIMRRKTNKMVKRVQDLTLECLHRKMCCRKVSGKTRSDIFSRQMTHPWPWVCIVKQCTNTRSLSVYPSLILVPPFPLSCSAVSAVFSSLWSAVMRDIFLWNLWWNKIVIKHCFNLKDQTAVCFSKEVQQGQRLDTGSGSCRGLLRSQTQPDPNLQVSYLILWLNSNESR